MTPIPVFSCFARLAVAKTARFCVWVALRLNDNLEQGSDALVDGHHIFAV
jgi:hypothetical protein